MMYYIRADFNRVTILFMFSALVKRDVKGPPSIQNVVPEHLRPPPPFYHKFLRFLKSNEMPMLPITIAVLGTHIFVINYLRSDEFKEDFKDCERLPVYAVN